MTPISILVPYRCFGRRPRVLPDIDDLDARLIQFPHKEHHMPNPATNATPVPTAANLRDIQALQDLRLGVELDQQKLRC